MIAHGARTHTVCEWTGLHPDHVRSLYKSYTSEGATGQGPRRRGPSPHQVARYLKTGQDRSEAAAMIGLCMTLEVLPEVPLKNPRVELPCLWRGERLCKAYELFRMIVPRPTMTFEQAVLLLIAVAEEAEIRVTRCKSCKAVMLSNPGGMGQGRCSPCGSTSKSLAGLSA